MQHHARQGLAWPLASMRSALLGALHLAGVLQYPLGPGVAELEAVLRHQLLVEVLDVEVEVLRRIELNHPRRHVDRQPPPRHAAHAPIVEPLGTRGLITRSVAQEIPLRHAQDIRRLRTTQTAMLKPPVDLLEPHRPY